MEQERLPCILPKQCLVPILKTCKSQQFEFKLILLPFIECGPSIAYRGQAFNWTGTQIHVGRPYKSTDYM